MSSDDDLPSYRQYRCALLERPDSAHTAGGYDEEDAALDYAQDNVVMSQGDVAWVLVSDPLLLDADGPVKPTCWRVECTMSFGPVNMREVDEQPEDEARAEWAERGGELPRLLAH